MGMIQSLIAGHFNLHKKARLPRLRKAASLVIP
jgi:hypothetical protein